MDVLKIRTLIPKYSLEIHKGKFKLLYVQLQNPIFFFQTYFQNSLYFLAILLLFMNLTLLEA